MKITNIHSKVEITKLLELKESHTNSDIIEVLFEKPVPMNNYFFNNYIMWFGNNYIPNPIRYNKKGQIIGVFTTVNTLLDFLAIKKEFFNFNRCLERLNSLGIYFDREKWKRRIIFS